MCFNKSIISYLCLSHGLYLLPTTAAEPLLSIKTERTAPRAASINQQWLNECGRAEINVGKTDRDLQSNLALLRPLKRDQRQLLFTQGNWQHRQGKTTLNIGVGQRWFTSTAGYWGYHLFYDYRLQGQHQRVGVGVEQRRSTLFWALNGYHPLSAKQRADNPARGIDLRGQYRPRRQPN